MTALVRESCLEFQVGRWYRMYREFGWCLLPTNETIITGDQYCGDESIAKEMNTYGKASIILTDGHGFTDEQNSEASKAKKEIEDRFK